MFFYFISIAVLWSAGIWGISIMKKYEPDNKIYPLWVLTVALCITLYYGYQYLKFL